jgi:hypothetical protein
MFYVSYPLVTYLLTLPRSNVHHDETKGTLLLKRIHQPYSSTANKTVSGAGGRGGRQKRKICQYQDRGCFDRFSLTNAWI